MGATASLSLPTRREDWHLVGRTLRLVLSIPLYSVLAALAAVGSLSVFVLSRNVPLLTNVVLGGSLPLSNRLEVLVSLYPLVGTGYTLVQSLLLVATSVLVGVNLALVTYHFREHGLSAQEGSGSVLGVVLGTLGAGCASCGAAVLAGLFSLLGAGSAATLLPLDGLEFSMLALVVLPLSTYWVAEGLRGGRIRGCPVDP